MSRNLILLLPCLFLLAASATQVYYSDIPKFAPINSTLMIKTYYTLSTFLPLNLTTVSSFIVDFSYSKISPPVGNINCSYLNQTTNVYVSFSNCICTSAKLCTLAPGANFSQFYNLLIRFGQLQNPLNVNNQPISMTVNISSTRYSLVSTIISREFYTSNNITMSSFNQSDFSVASANVLYSFVFSIGPYIPQDASLQLIIPTEVGISLTGYVCTFAGSSQTGNPSFISSNNQSILTFNFKNSQIFNASSVQSSLNITGFINPRFIGQSSTFQMIIKDVKDVGCNIGCAISQLRSSVVSSSTTSGDLFVFSMFSDNTLVNQPCNIILNIQLFAPIPEGGRLSIILPSGVTPILPVTCNNIKGYSIANNQPPTCTYDAASNNISTVNFAYPFLVTTSTAVMSFGIINPPDSSSYRFRFQTLDQLGRIIGNSRNGYGYSADPGDLTISAQRNDTTVDAWLKLSFNISFKNPISAGGRLQILLPTEMANVTGTPVCLTTGAVSLNCTGSWSADFSIYNLSFVPVCQQGCTTGGFIVFTVTGLRNPSYISTNPSEIVVQSVSANFLGIVDTSPITLSDLTLTKSNSTVSSVNVAGSNIAGNEQTITLTFSISSYFQFNDGQIDIMLPQNATFVFDTPRAFVVASNGSLLPITATYQQHSNPMASISRITVSQACTKINCSQSLTIQIRGITYSYSSKTYSPYTFTISTTNGAPISQGSFTYPVAAPAARQSSLTVIPTSQVTGAMSNYNISFVPSIPIDSTSNGGYITIALPSDLDINQTSGCSVSTNISLGFSLSCSLSNKIVTIGYTTGNPQSLKNTQITLVLSNSRNPESTIPLNYSLSTFFNGAISETFSSVVQLTTPSTATLSYNKKNNTYNTSTTLTIQPTFNFNITSSDIISITFPQNLFSYSSNSVSLANMANQVGSAVATVVSNLTHKTISFSSLWTSNSLSISMPITNPATTKQLPNLILTTSRSNYSSQTATVSILPCDPMVLSGTVASSVRTTGELTNLTFTFNKNSNSDSCKLVLPTGAWENTTYNSTIMLTSSNPNVIVVQNLTNKPDVKPITDSITLSCQDTNGSLVEVMTVDASTLVANSPKRINMSAIRSVLDSSAATSLTINISHFNYQTNNSVIQIDLPANQFWIGSVACQFISNSTIQACQVKNVTNQTILLNHPCASKCSNFSYQIVLTGIGNLYADTTLTNISVLNGGYLSETSSFLVTPAITTPTLSNTTITLTDKNIATNSLLTVIFSSPLPVPQNSTVSIFFDDLVFLPNGDCSYSIGLTNYTGCTFNNSAAGYVLSARLKTLGMSTIPANSSIQIQIPFTNSFAAFNISSAKITVNVSATNFTIGSFSTNMRVILNGDTFTPSSLRNVTLTRNTTQCNASLSLSLSVTVPVSFYMNSVLNLMIPKDEVVLSQLQSTNGTMTLISQDSSYYYYSLVQSVCQTARCFPQTLTFTITGLTNSKYPIYSPNSFMVSLTFNNTVIAPQRTVSINSLEASQATITATRANQESLQPTTITLKILLPEAITSSVTLKISTSLPIFSNITSIVQQESNSQLSYIVDQQNSFVYNISVVVNNLQKSNTFLLQLTNSPYSPLSGSKIDLIVYNSSMLFYSNKLIPIANEITPYNKNITLTRSTTTVSRPYTLRISGNLPQINIVNYTMTVGNNTFFMNSSTFDLTVPSLTNPLDIVDVSMPVRISSSNNVVYDSTLILTPPLEPIQYVSHVSLNTLVIDKMSNLTVKIDQAQASEVNITVPSGLFSKINNCYNSDSVANFTYSSLNATATMVRFRNVDASSILTIEMQLVPYVTEVKSPIDISVKLPFGVSSTALEVRLVAQSIPVTATLTSYKINDQNSIKLDIEPSTIIGTHLLVSLPFEYHSVDIVGCTFTKVDTKNIRIDTFPNKIVVQFSNITNPYDDRPMTVNVKQINNNGSLIAEGSTSYQMTEVGNILVQDAVRNSSNLNAPISVSIKLLFDSSGSNLLVRLLPSQVYYFGGISCLVDNVTTDCINQGTVVNISGTFSKTNIITINGFSNSKSSQKLAQNDTMSFTLFNQEGYTVAKSKEKSFLIPEEITGNITISNFVSTSQTIFTPTDLSFRFVLQNNLTTNSILVIQQNSSYIAIPDVSLSCQLNNLSQQCQVRNNQTVITFSDTTVTGGTIQLKNMYTGIQTGKIKIKSVDSEHDADIDSVTIDNPFSSYNPYPLVFRIIMSDNTVGRRDVMLVMDSFLPRLSDRIYQLEVSIQNSDLSGISLAVDSNVVSTVSQVVVPSTRFEKIQLSNVLFSVVGNTLFNVQLKTENIVLALASSNRMILSESSNICADVDCQKCATTTNGQEQCLGCREGMVSWEGRCQKSCNDGTFSYNGVCQQCSVSCKTCFGPMSTDCLSCHEPLIDNSGVCTDSSNCTGKVSEGYCLNEGDCPVGCKKCSPSLFCYECLENYKGFGKCVKIRNVPETFFSYFVATPVLVWLALTLITMVKCHGFTSFLGISIFSLSLVEMLCNIMMIPLTETLLTTIIVSSIIVVRLVISVASYEAYFKAYIYKDEQLLAKQLTNKDKIVGFFAHIINVDSYMLYLSKIGLPVIDKSMPFSHGLKVFNIVNMILRLVLAVFAGWLLSQMRLGDYTLVPLVCLAAQLLLMLFHLMANPYIFDKMAQCINRILSR